MSSSVLHIKDSYYFEIPKSLWRSQRTAREDFPEFWVRRDPDYQLWEARQLYPALQQVFGQAVEVPSQESLLHDYEHWKEADHKNFGKPFERYLQEAVPWFRDRLVVDPKSAAGKGASADALLRARESAADWQAKWREAKVGKVNFDDYRAEWSSEKVEGYNRVLDGKVLIPQPFGVPNNLYEPGSGFCISRFMVVEVVVGLVILGLFTWLARRMSQGGPPRGRLWNMLEGVLLFIRNEVARPAIGAHEGDKFVPVLWTIFLFILGCNVMGLVPWAGSPTGAFGVTIAMALVTLTVGWFSGTMQLGVVGYWKNLVPHMDLPWYIAFLIKPAIFLIELLSLFIKHGVLAIRLLANMVAGHLVLLAIMGMAFSLEAAMNLTGASWYVTALVSIVGSTLLSVLELFVALLQAYIFTFLSALFIGAAVHHH